MHFSRHEADADERRKRKVEMKTVCCFWCSSRPWLSWSSLQAMKLKQVNWKYFTAYIVVLMPWFWVNVYRHIFLCWYNPSDTLLSDCPRRRTDSSFVINEEENLKKHRMVEGDVKRLKRLPSLTADSKSNLLFFLPGRRALNNSIGTTAGIADSFSVIDLSTFSKIPSLIPYVSFVC